jgi:hypothetical protein
VDNTNLYVLQNCDIWSLGCIFSEALVWSTFGWGGVKGLKSYRSRRLREAKVYDLHDGACFHNREVLLSTVQDVHQLLVEERPDDYFTREVLNMIGDMMVIDPDLRSSVQKLMTRPTSILNGAKMRPEYSTAADTNDSGSSSPRPLTPLGGPPPPPSSADGASGRDTPSENGGSSYDTNTAQKGKNSSHRTNESPHMMGQRPLEEPSTNEGPPPQLPLERISSAPLQPGPPQPPLRRVISEERAYTTRPINDHHANKISHEVDTSITPKRTNPITEHSHGMPSCSFDHVWRWRNARKTGDQQARLPFGHRLNLLRNRDHVRAVPTGIIPL